jgi:hypothetical protein
MANSNNSRKRNVMVVDGAENCAYDIYATSEEDFGIFFPAPDQDIAFIDEIVTGASSSDATVALARLWDHRVEKRNAVGIHGTIFFELQNKKQFYPNRKDSDLTSNLSRARD